MKSKITPMHRPNFFCLLSFRKAAMITLFFIIVLRPAQLLHAQAIVWKAGDKVEAGPGGYHPATVLKVSDAKVSFYLHYEDNSHPDDWVQGYWIRARNTQVKADIAAKSGPRLGKYLIYGYATGFAAYNGYFMLMAGNRYELFLPGGKSAGSGTYSFDKTTTTVKWNSGPFASKDWDGTQKLDVERDGKTHIIRLKARTIGSNSIDSTVK